MFYQMKIIADLHIHGPYAQACSRNTTLARLEGGARLKGLNILGTGDCLHPKWFQSITTELTEDDNGVLWSKTKFPFLWQTEISLMYTHNGKGRRIHHVVLMPNKDVVIQVRDTLLKRGRLDYDGRPIFGINSIEFVDMMRSISKDIEIIPAHAWTSWMSIFGSKSGFDSVEECFEDRAKHIHAIETGLSSDPMMNRRVSKLDKYNIVSFSDMHSYHPWRLGREATIFDIDNISYSGILNAIRTGNGLSGTIEVNPAYGKYHLDGHRACNIVMNYIESRKLKGICPNCKMPLTLGVEYRVEQLADRIQPVNVPYFKSVIPLSEMIASVYGVKLLSSKKISDIYNRLIQNFGDEYKILLDTPFSSLSKIADKKLADVIILNRENKLDIRAGYDGVYGEIMLNNKAVNKESAMIKLAQSDLHNF